MGQLIENLRLIAHRGLLNGPDPDLENRPEEIDKAINYGFDVEVDVRVISDPSQGDRYPLAAFLGHDEGQYEVPFEWLVERNGVLWIHCKNIETYVTLLNYNYRSSPLDQLHLFFHDKDDVTRTSEGYMWYYPGKQVEDRSYNNSYCGSRRVQVMPEWELSTFFPQELSHICTDHPFFYKKVWHQYFTMENRVKLSIILFYLGKLAEEYGTTVVPDEQSYHLDIFHFRFAGSSLLDGVEFEVNFHLNALIMRVNPGLITEATKWLKNLSGQYSAGIEYFISETEKFIAEYRNQGDTWKE